MLVSFLIFCLFFALFLPCKRAQLRSPTHSPFLMPSDGRIPPQFLACFFAIPRSAPYCEHMLVSFFIFGLFFALFLPWKRALLLSPTHSLFRLPSDGRIPPQFLARFFAIPRSTPCCEGMLVSFFIFCLFFTLFFPWKRALLLSPTHSLLRLLSDGRIPSWVRAWFFAIPR